MVTPQHGSLFFRRLNPAFRIAHESISFVSALSQIISFSSLMFSKEMVLNQFGFLLCFAVLLGTLLSHVLPVSLALKKERQTLSCADTFVVRPILVPSMMFLIGRWNWWPQNMPQPIHVCVLS